MTEPACPGEETLLRFIQGQLEEATRRALRVHLKGCERCRKAIVEALAVLHEGDTLPAIPLPASRRAGRYELKDILGIGAMGVVYSALDPELGRRVAVKILRPPSAQASGAAIRDELRQRFVRESRSLARVVHPNVVSIFDVGETGDAVFIVMELVDGGTLRDWLDAERRSLDEIVQVFEQIGRGLAAVHKAGLVHRDFKPENALLGRDGRARVTDFGLARGEWTPVDEASERATTEPGDLSGDRPALSSLTQTGDLLGTPGYMALEQLRGQAADARSDQFAFAAALWEAVFGKRPFAGATFAALAENIAAQRFAPTEPTPHPPAKLAKLVPLLQRALSSKPEDRFESLDELLIKLHELRPPPVPARRWRIGVAAVLILGSLSSVGLYWRSFGTGRCQGSPVESAWRTRLRPTLAALTGGAGSPGTKALAAQTLAILDDQARLFAQTQQAICEATYVTRSQTEQAFAAQSECLLRRQTRFELVVSTVSTPPLDWPRAAELATFLDSPADCRSVAVDLRPRSQSVEQRKELLARLDAALHEVSLGHLPQVETALPGIRGRAQELGDETTAAEAMLVEAQIRLRQGNIDAARRLVNEATATALTNRATDVALKGYAIGTRAFAVGTTSIDDAERMARLFEQLASSTGRGATLRPRVLAALADAYTQNGRHAEALRVLGQGMALPETSVQARAELGHALGKTLMNLGKPGEAGLAMDRAVIDAVAGFGADSLTTLGMLGDRVWVDYGVGGAARAVPGQRRFLAQVERFGTEEPRLLVDALHNLSAYLASTSDRNEEALALERRASELAEAQLPPDSPSRINSMIGLAAKLVDWKKEDEALPILDRVRPAVEPPDRIGAPNPSAIFLNITYAHALQGRDPTAALRHITRMRAQAEKFAKRPDVAAMLKEADELEPLLRGKARAR